MSHSWHQDQPGRGPKYNFGLLETPGSSSSETRFNKTSSTGTGPIRPNGFGSRTSEVPQSSSSLDVPLSLQTPRPNFSKFKTPRSILSSNPGKTPQMSAFSSARSRTPGSTRTPYAATSTTPAVNGGEPNTAIITALVEGRGVARGEIGMASIDLKRPVLVLSQFPDSQTYVKVLTKLQLHPPIEILMPTTSCENGTMTPLFKLVSDHYQSTNIVTVQRKYFNESKGLQYIKQLCLPDNKTVEMEITTKYYCLAATAALLKYVEFIQNVVYAPRSIKVIFKGSEQTAMIDVSTSRNLELLVNLRDPHSQHTLFGVLNFTKTPPGARLLRSSLLQPPTSVETIRTRQEAVAELTEKEDLFFDLQTAVSRFPDVEHLLSACVQVPRAETVRTAEAKISNVICLKHALQLVAPLQTALQPSENALFRAYHESLSDPRFELMLEKIGRVINDETQYQKGTLNMRTQKCFAVKPKINGLLDVARRTYTEIVDDIGTLIQQLGELHDLPFKMGYNATRGFHVQLYSAGGAAGLQLDSLPAGIIKAVRAKSTISCTTTDLIKLNDRVKASLQEIYLMTNVVLTELMKDVVEHIGCLYLLTECLSMIDMLVAFAHNCTLSDYVRPEFTDTLAIKQGRHPILDKIMVDPPIPNNAYASEETNFIVITGPNMSGKSTYVRQVALLQIMAQVGSFVPAEYASFRVADQVFSRIGSDDDMETNSSTFMVEMREINYIVRNASRKSLVIIDELGRGTSVDEGMGICHAICEYLLNLKAYTFMATHFMELTNLQSLYPNVENSFFQVQHVQSENEDRHVQKVLYTHVLAKGIMAERHYGLALAEVSTLPKCVVDNARSMTETLDQQKKVSRRLTEAERRQRAIFKTAMKLVQTARNSRLDVDSLRLYLVSLKHQHTRHLQAASATDEE